MFWGDPRQNEGFWESNMLVKDVGNSTNHTNDGFEVLCKMRPFVVTPTQIRNIRPVFLELFKHSSRRPSMKQEQMFKVIKNKLLD